MNPKDDKAPPSAATTPPAGGAPPPPKKDLLSDSKIALGASPEDRELSRIALDRNLIDVPLLEECLRTKEESRTRGEDVLLGELLVKKGGVKANDVIRLMKEQSRRREGCPSIPRYDIQGRAGEGATAVVYAAWDRELKRPVALKVLKGASVMSDLARHRFRREATAAAGILHPNVVSVYDVGEAEGQPYLVLELVDGKPLSEALAAGDRSLNERVALLEKVARGVAAAHEKGVVHRDLKPQNILLGSGGLPKVADFGLAHLLNSETELTKTGTALGTPLYMAPEQVRGLADEISPRTDVYALGAILYEMATGHCPHVGGTLVEIYRKIVEEDPAPLRAVRPDLPRDLESMTLKAIEKNPSSRYADAGEFADDMRRFLAGEPVRAHPPGAA